MAEMISKFALEYDPLARMASAQMRSVFGDRYLKLDLYNVASASDGGFTGLPGITVSLSLEWKDENGRQREALLILSRDTGQVFFYSQQNEYSGNSISESLLVRSRNFINGLINETNSKWNQWTGAWYREGEVENVSFGRER